MNESLKIKAKNSGFKVKALAERIGVTPNYLSMCLRGERILAENKCIELKKFLEKIPS